MSEAATTLLEQVLRLAEDERAAVASRVWESLSEAKQLELSDAEDAEFEAEIARRSDSVHDGSAELLTWQEARARIEAELERRQAARTNGTSP